MSPERQLSRLQRGESVEERDDVRDERANAVDDCPCDPYSFEPIPRLIGFLLSVGHLGADDRDRGHTARQHRADARDAVVDVHNDRSRHAPKVVYRERGERQERYEKQERKTDEVTAIDFFHGFLLNREIDRSGKRRPDLGLRVSIPTLHKI